MKFPPHFLRIATVGIASILLVIAVAAVRPVCAAEFQAETDAERYVLEQFKIGADVALEFKFPPESFPSSKREVRGSFIAALLTDRMANLKINSGGIKIRSAVITGLLDLRGEKIPYDVYLSSCTFDSVDLRYSQFAKGLYLINSIFTGMALFDGATIAVDFVAGGSRFGSSASFLLARTGGDFRIMHTTFEESVVFNRMRVGGTFAADESKFVSKYSWFEELRVDGDFSAEDCSFGYLKGASKEVGEDWGGSTVSFVGSHFANVFLKNSSFDRISIIDFTRMQADFISFDGVTSKTPSEVRLQRMSFKILSPVNAGQLEFLLSPYNAEFYTDLETSWRTHGHPDEADKIFIAKRRAERRENCEDFWRKCNRVTWASSMFQDMLAGYGKRLQNLLYWSLGFLIIGTFVFRSEKGMRTKDEKNTERYKGRYHAFWYSLDLFLPIIKLGESEVWTPKDDRRWAHLYRKVHIIIGSLFVPIGLAAWTGIIK